MGHVIHRSLNHYGLDADNGIEPTDKKFDLIYADCPWKTSDPNRNGKRGAACKYRVMSTREICNMGNFIDSLAKENCVLAMWWISCMPSDALKVVDAWGFKLWNMNGFVWQKQTAKGKEHFGLGRTTRPSIEPCLFAKRGNPKSVVHNVRQVITAPIGIHSEKPPEARDRLDKLFAPKTKIELFARTKTLGWDVWGDEV